MIFIHRGPSFAGRVAIKLTFPITTTRDSNVVNQLRNASGFCQFHGIESLVRCAYHRPDGIGILCITDNPYANGKPWLFRIFRSKIANPVCYQCRGGYAGLRQNQSKLVSALPRCGVYGPAATCQDVRQPAERPVSR